MITLPTELPTNSFPEPVVENAVGRAFSSPEAVAEAERNALEIAHRKRWKAQQTLVLIDDQEQEERVQEKIHAARIAQDTFLRNEQEEQSERSTNSEREKSKIQRIFEAAWIWTQAVFAQIVDKARDAAAYVWEKVTAGWEGVS